jgi:hypothetical protein
VKEYRLKTKREREKKMAYRAERYLARAEGMDAEMYPEKKH